MNRTVSLITLALLAAMIAAPAIASQPPMPEWDQLDAQTRDTLIAPTRERWNSDSDGRERMLQRAQRWDTMTAEQRKHARHGIERWKHMSPEQRVEARALYNKMHGMDQEGRNALHEKWRAMTPEQRKSWVEANPASAEHDPAH